ncbi:MAG: hypothetical protein HZA05_01895 [Nitrospirae bacterium]|nr:hypothetical protein [Nitrospirota bacterium]
MSINMFNAREEKLKSLYIAVWLYKVFMAIGIITVILLSPAHGQDARQAPPEVVKAIPISLVYEGSIVSVIWESQKNDVDLLFKDGRWRINRGRLNTNNIKGRVSIVGTVGKDTTLEHGMILHGSELFFTTEIK